MKAVATGYAANAAEDCRKACGGQGFLRASGLPDLITQAQGNVTAEGEQIILGLQTARYLIKTVAAVKAGETVPASMEYLAEADRAAERRLNELLSAVRPDAVSLADAWQFTDAQ